MEIQINGKKIVYEVRGNGQSVVLVHGWGGSKESMKGIYNELLTNYKVFILDLPGFGESDLPEKDWGVDEYSEIVMKFMKQMKLNKPVFFGHSFGGGIGIKLASENRAYFSKLILCAAAYYREPKEASSIKYFKKVLPNYDQVKKKLSPLKRLYYKALHPRSDSQKHPELESNFRKIITQDLCEEAKLIITPTLLLWGDKDIDTPISHAKKLKSFIRGSELKVYENKSHSLPLKEPVEITTQIDNFIKKK